MDTTFHAYDELAVLFWTAIVIVTLGILALATATIHSWGRAPPAMPPTPLPPQRSAYNFRW